MNDLTNLSLVLLAAFWSGTNTVFTGIKETNSVRDKIINGKVDDREMPIEERRHLLLWDWIPLKLSLALISATLCAVILLLPQLHGGYHGVGRFGTVCLIAASMPALGACFQVISFAADFHYLRRILTVSQKS